LFRVGDGRDRVGCFRCGRRDDERNVAADDQFAGDFRRAVRVRLAVAYYDLDRLWADAPRVPFEEPRVAAAER